MSEFSVYLQQRPGELAGVLDAAKAAGVQIISISTTEHQERGCVRLIGTPEAALRQTCESLSDAGLGPVVESPVVGVGIENRPGVIRDLSVLMADNRLNIRYCYLVPQAAGIEGALCVLRFDEHERAMELITQTDWPMIEHPGDTDDNPSGSITDESAA
ncbi:MAG: hypothetical protein AB8C13_09145 [Phycisphaerales bacterium]